MKVKKGGTIMNLNAMVTEFCVAGGTSLAVATSVNAEPLLTALITLGTTIVTMVGGELVKFLIAYFKNKTKKYEEEKGEDKHEDKK